MSERSEGPIPVKLLAGIGALLEALWYAQDVDGDRWEFAVAIRRLFELGCTDTDLRWLVRKGYVEHAQEVTPQGDNGRAFRRTGDLTFSKRTCFVLTDVGASQVCSTIDTQAVVADTNALAADYSRQVVSNSPNWDTDERTLYFDGQIVKQLKRRAANQEAILAAFQEEGWPRRIDDPLMPQPEQDPRRRLSDTIKALNNNQLNRLVRFHGDGTGEGITWEPVESNSKPSLAT